MNQLKTVILMAICASCIYGSDFTRVFIWRSDINTGGKCLSRPFSFERSPADSIEVRDDNADFGLGNFPVRRVLLDSDAVDSLKKIIDNPFYRKSKSKCQAVLWVKEDAAGHRTHGLLRLDAFVKWIDRVGGQPSSEFHKYFLEALNRCCGN